MAAAKTKQSQREPESVPDWTVIVGLRGTKLASQAQRHEEINQEIKALKKEQADIKAEGVKLLTKAGVKSVMVGDLRVTRYDGNSSRLDKKKLGRKHPEALDWIAEATVKTPFTTLKVTAPKEEEEDEDGDE